MVRDVLDNRDKDCTAYCEQCNSYTEVRLVDEIENLEIDGTAYSYPVRHGYCVRCGGNATPQKVLEDNQRSFSDAVRRLHHIVSQGTVEGLVVRYNIKPRPLSSLLGWGEHTYSRFMEGDIPSKSFSDRIETLWSSPLSYLLLLLNNGCALSGVARRKSTSAAQKALVTCAPKSDRVAAYLIGRTESNSSLALQKELYYAQGLMLAFYGRPLFSERCEAWKMGPVFPDVWERVKPREVDEELLLESNLDECVRDSFTDEELEVLDTVVTYVARYSPYVLRDVTHKERPWIEARGTLSEDDSSNSEIGEERIKAYFESVRKDYGIDRLSDFSLYMEQMLSR